MIPTLITFCLSVLLCFLYRRFALSQKILAQPNARSSHEKSTPHGGGVPLFAAFIVGVSIYAFQSGIGFAYVIMIGLSAALVLVGVLDDLFSLNMGLRFGIYFAVALLAASYLLPDAFDSLAMRVCAVLFVAICITWSVNLFNFMDGIDGIAGSQAALACAIAALLSGNAEYAIVCSLLAAAHAGFLVWNWPPASLFMGDAGSIPTGFLLAVLAVLGWSSGTLNLACWLILLSPFIVDATATLIWRILSGQKFTQAHRTHAYQRLSRLWGSHRPVVLALVAVMLLWLGPLAWAAQQLPSNVFILVIFAYLPWVIAMAKIPAIK